LRNPKYEERDPEKNETRNMKREQREVPKAQLSLPPESNPTGTPKESILAWHLPMIISSASGVKKLGKKIKWADFNPVTGRGQRQSPQTWCRLPR
jgi:hypothetical protein